MKRVLFIIVLVLLITPGLLAANQYKARLTIINQTGEDIYISMEYPYTWLTAKYKEPITQTDRPKSVFTIERDVYKDVKVYVCGAVFAGTLDLTRNLRLNFTPCDEMYQYDRPRYLGEPSMEKPNWFRTPGLADWRFLYTIEDNGK